MLKSNNIMERNLELLNNFVDCEKEEIKILKKAKADEERSIKRIEVLHKEREEIKKSMEAMDDDFDQMRMELGIF